MVIDNWTRCYHGIQRSYRNCVVAFLRERLTQAFPGEWQAKLRAPFGKEWEHIVLNAQASRTSGATEAPIKDEFDYLSVNHFYNLFSEHFEVLFPALPGTEERSQLKSAMLRWCKTIKDFRDPMSHPPEADVSLLDAVAMLDAARRVAVHIDTNVAKDIEAIISSLMRGELAPATERPPLDDSLPPAESIVVNFVERGNELRELWAWFEHPTSHRWVVHGAGGKGKTAIAYQFALQVKHKAPESYSAVWWLSAKKRRFLEGETVPIENPDFSGLETAFNKLLFDYGGTEHLRKPLDDKKRLLLQLLTDLPALLVVDDIDALEGEDELAVEFFTVDVPTTPSKVLLTSRRRLFGLGGTETEVKGFAGEEGYRFVASRLKLFGLDPKGLTKTIMDMILKATEGSPLYIDDLLRYFASGRPLIEVIEL